MKQPRKHIIKNIAEAGRKRQRGKSHSFERKKSGRSQ